MRQILSYVAVAVVTVVVMYLAISFIRGYGYQEVVFSTINSSFVPSLVPTIEPWNCIEWDKVDTSYDGKYVCVKGIVAIGGKFGAPVFFSNQPNTLYVAGGIVSGFPKGSCLLVGGIVRADASLTLYITPQTVSLCR